jgi:glutamate-1-semialdehyde 2,1-aminomutase
MTAGLWSLGQLKGALYRRLARVGRDSRPGSPTPHATPGSPLQVNAIGSMLTPFFTNQPVRDYRSATSADAAAYGRFFQGMLRRGVYLPPSQFEAWFPSAAHGDGEIERTLAAARATFRELGGRS